MFSHVACRPNPYIACDPGDDERQAQASGTEVGNVSAFLGLTDDEATIVELKLGLANAVKEQRSRRSLTQEQLGRMLG
jgi:hypothetical protein